MLKEKFILQADICLYKVKLTWLALPSYLKQVYSS